MLARGEMKAVFDLCRRLLPIANRLEQNQYQRRVTVLSPQERKAAQEHGPLRIAGNLSDFKLLEVVTLLLGQDLSNLRIHLHDKWRQESARFNGL